MTRLAFDSAAKIRRLAYFRCFLIAEATTVSGIIAARLRGAAGFHTSVAMGAEPSGGNLPFEVFGMVPIALDRAC